MKRFTVIFIAILAITFNISHAGGKKDDKMKKYESSGAQTSIIADFGHNKDDCTYISVTVRAYENFNDYTDPASGKGSHYYKWAQVNIYTHDMCLGDDYEVSGYLSHEDVDFPYENDGKYASASGCLVIEDRPQRISSTVCFQVRLARDDNGRFGDNRHKGNYYGPDKYHSKHDEESTWHDAVVTGNITLDGKTLETEYPWGQIRDLEWVRKTKSLYSGGKG